MIGTSVNEAVVQYLQLREEKARANAYAEAAGKAVREFEEKLAELFIEEGVKGIEVDSDDGPKKVSITNTEYLRFAAGGDQEKLCEFLAGSEETSYLVKTSADVRSVMSWVKQLRDSGENIPEELFECVESASRITFSVRKGRA